MMNQDGLHKGLTERIIGAAMEVHRELRNGLDEKIYEQALCIELTAHGLQCDQQKRYAVTYKSHPVGTMVPDLIVESCVIVETKVVESFNDAHVSQVIGYLKISGLKVGLLLNFKHDSLKIKRITI